MFTPSLQCCGHLVLVGSHLGAVVLMWLEDGRGASAELSWLHPHLISCCPVRPPASSPVLTLNTNVPGPGKAGSLVLQACACCGLNCVLKIHMLSPDPQDLRMGLCLEMRSLKK